MNLIAQSTTVSNSVSCDEFADLQSRFDFLERKLASLEKQIPDTNKLNLVVFSASRDKLLASFVLATGGAACGMEVTMFFTFWACAALRRGGPQFGKKSVVERAFGWMLPASLNRTKLSQMDMAGVGRHLMAAEMKKKKVADLEELIQTAAALGVTIKVCEMSMQLMGIRREELRDYPGISYCGVASLVDDATRSNTTLFL